MKIKSTVIGLVAASFMLAAVGPIQAACYRYQPGWHMVSKYCDIRPAVTWQEYNSGVYTPPQPGRYGLIPFLPYWY
jgi:hypothetical protein